MIPIELYPDEYLRVIRARLEMTQAELARRLGRRAPHRAALRGRRLQDTEGAAGGSQAHGGRDVMFVSEPVDGAVYVAQRRTRGGRLPMWTIVPIAPGPEVRVLPDHRDLRVHALKKCGLATLTGNAS